MRDKKLISREDWFVIVGFFWVIAIWWCWGVFGADAMRAKIAKAAKNETIALSNSTPKVSVEKTLPAQGVELNDYFQQLGQTGDLFGGVNALFAAIAVVGVFYAGALQRRTMLESRRAISRQQFETVFFELLRLTREVAEDIQVRGKKTSSRNSNDERETVMHGVKALNALAYIHFNDLSGSNANTADQTKILSLKTMVAVYKTRVYQAQPSTLGPYWRLLYQMFLLVDNAPLEENEKIRFANIIRGQISEGAVFLLALNGLSWRGQKFISLIEKYGLLEHMHARYRERHEAAFLMAYKRHAFMGSAERFKTPEKPAPIAGPEVIDVQPKGAEIVERNFPYEEELKGFETTP